MTTRISILAALSLGLLATVASAQTPSHQPKGINAREHRQAARIKDGVADKELTKAELDRLHANEAAVRAEERVYRQSGNGLNKAETKILERDLNKTSREIYRAKHNQRIPGGGQ